MSLWFLARVRRIPRSFQFLGEMARLLDLQPEDDQPPALVVVIAGRDAYDVPPMLLDGIESLSQVPGLSSVCVINLTSSTLAP